MEEDQQFCLRWNNHQSTLISVFDTLLENGTLVDCTLAAEGKFLKAHKVVLSACSPYFATLLSEQYDKHPIFILKDVKYQELRAMMDYMYRGEVNISQDQLAALLKAAESLQIKGLSDNRGGAGSGGSKAGEPQKHSTTGHHVPGKMTNIGHMGAGYTLEQAKRARIGPSSIDSQDIGGSREGSSSPTSRRRKKIRRRSVDNVMGDNHENSNSSQNMQINSSVTGPGAITTSIVPSGAVAQAASGNQIQTQTNKKTDNLSKLDQGVSVSTINPTASATANVSDEHDEDGPGSNKKEHHLQSAKKDKEVVGVSGSATSSDIVIEPKSEYDDGNEETVEDLTLDDEMALDELDQTAGPSHGGEGSSQGYAQWQVDRSHDESYMAQDVQQRDPQDYLNSSEVKIIPTITVKKVQSLQKTEVNLNDVQEPLEIDGRAMASRIEQLTHIIAQMSSKLDKQMVVIQSMSMNGFMPLPNAGAIPLEVLPSENEFLPVSTIENMEILEEKIANEETFRVNLVHNLCYKCVEPNISLNKIIASIMKCLVSDSLLKDFSFKGQSEDKPNGFIKFRFIHNFFFSVLNYAVGVNKLLIQPSEVAVNNSISAFIRHAVEREARNKKRDSKQKKNPFDNIEFVKP